MKDIIAMKRMSMRGKSSLSIALLSVASLTSIVIISNGLAHADSSIVDEISITVPVSCTMEGTGQTSHNADINNSNYVSNIGTTTIKAYCNDNDGFAIYAAGYTGNEIGNNVLTNLTLGSTYDIITGTATSAGSSDVSNWAMKLGTVTSSTPTYPIIISGSSSDTEKESGAPDFSNYTLVPDSYAKVAYRNASTDIPSESAVAEGSTLTTTYAAYISRTQPAGTYSGQVIYTLLHPASASTSLRLIYDGNNAGEGSMDAYNRDDVQENDTIELSTNLFTRTGYEFAGWSFDPDADPSDAEAVIYAPGDTVTIAGDVLAKVDEGNQLKLYAVWTPISYTISYDGNGGEFVGEANGGMTLSDLVHVDVTIGSAVSLIASNFRNDGYGFAGWSPDPYADPNDPDALMFGPNETINITEEIIQTSETVNPGTMDIVMYAIWVEAGGQLQDFNPSWVRYLAMPTGTIMALVDNRDGNVYAVAKLADGNWWMIENLRLDLSDENVRNNINEFTTNNPSEESFINYELANVEPPYYTGEYHISFGIGNISEDYPAYPGRVRLENGSIPYLEDSDYLPDDEMEVAWYSYGVMYSSFTARTGHQRLAFGGNNPYSSDTMGDICPKGWRLPRAYRTASGEVEGGDYIDLDMALGGGGLSESGTMSTWESMGAVRKWRKFPNNFVNSGLYHYSNSANDRGYAGSYLHVEYQGEYQYDGWGSTLFMVSGHEDYGSLNFDSPVDARNGYAVRCIAGTY